MIDIEKEVIQSWPVDGMSTQQMLEIKVACATWQQLKRSADAQERIADVMEEENTRGIKKRAEELAGKAVRNSPIAAQEGKVQGEPKKLRTEDPKNRYSPF